MRAPSFFFPEIFFLFGEWDSFRWCLRVLRGLVIVLTLIRILEGEIYNLVISSILLCLFFCFLVKNFFLFYVFFEIRLIPISILIIGWGYQPERLRAFYFIFLYTVRRSLPLLILILLYLTFGVRRFIDAIFFQVVNCDRDLNTLIMLFLVSGFMVKYPLYGVHLWLPKAHVEAPVRGSIILAGLLLKLGGFGVAQILRLIRGPILKIWLVRFRGAGGVIIRIICLRQTDTKILIAYSSVAHLRLSIICMFLKGKIMFLGRVIILISHGISSPGIFFGSFFLYGRFLRRRLLLRSGVSNLIPIFSLW